MQVFSHFGVDYFWPAEGEFLLKYVKILRPSAEALDVLQADKEFEAIASSSNDVAM